MKSNHSYTRAEFEHDLKAPTVAYGGYTIHFITPDGEPMSYEAAKSNKKLICDALEEREAGIHSRSQWLVLGKEINWEDNEMRCCHSGELIAANYPNGEHE